MANLGGRLLGRGRREGKLVIYIFWFILNFFKKFILFIYLFSAAWVFVAVRGLLTEVASLVAEHGL